MRKLIGGFLAAAVLVLASCASTPPAAVGVWDIQLDTPLGAMPATLTITEDGTGSMDAAMGQQNISGIVFDGDAVAFSTSIDAQGQSIMLNFAGTVEGDSLTGEFGSDFGAFGVTGSRK
ncbi:MAG: hypothetical protein R3F41_11755 [Gammaproteobacteria bacterium]|nr:hypothetical protein [Pseudomonadales bacterium]MCP5348288.1 hypothetical protein [Pseudomonadales bacterium]